MAEHVFGGQGFPALFDQLNGLEYGQVLCPNEKDVSDECWIGLVKGQNLENLILKLKIQNETLPEENIFPNEICIILKS